MKNFTLIYLVLIGAMLPLQGLMNAKLIDVSKNVMLTGLISAVITTLAIGATLLFLKTDLQFPTAVPWWAWFGGLAGAIYIVGFSFYATQIPLTTLLITTLAGQMGMSLLIDVLAKNPVGLRELSSALLIFLAMMILRK